MRDIEFLQIQAFELRRLLADAADDPVAEPQLRARITEIEEELDQATKGEMLLPIEVLQLPRFAMYFRGAGVGDTGIRPSLAGAALTQYEKMFTQQAIHDEREQVAKDGGQRRPRGARTPELRFVGTPRGSFGLEFVPEFTGDHGLLRVHSRTLERVAEAIAHVATGDDATFSDAIQPIPPGVLQPLKQFLRTLANQGVEVRLAFDAKAGQRIEAGQIQRAADRMERRIEVEEVEVAGTFRGVTRESGYFDIVLADGKTITGTVEEGLTEEDLEEIEKLTNKPCHAKMERTRVTDISGAIREDHILLSARPA